ncbi:hypothetical protein BC834DRAFT_850666, partial [Gloeopeniophorella convolvens]
MHPHDAASAPNQPPPPRQPVAPTYAQDTIAMALARTRPNGCAGYRAPRNRRLLVTCSITAATRPRPVPRRGEALFHGPARERNGIGRLPDIRSDAFEMRSVPAQGREGPGKARPGPLGRAGTARRPLRIAALRTHVLMPTFLRPKRMPKLGLEHGGLVLFSWRRIDHAGRHQNGYVL